MEQKPSYLGTKSDFYTHVHDLPPQLGGKRPVQSLTYLCSLSLLVDSVTYLCSLSLTSVALLT